MITAEKIKEALETAYDEMNQSLLDSEARGAFSMLSVAKTVVDKCFVDANPWEVIPVLQNRWVLSNRVTGQTHNYPSNGRQIIYKFQPNAIAAAKRLNSQ